MQLTILRLVEDAQKTNVRPQLGETTTQVVCAGESKWFSSSEAASTKKLLNSLHLVSRGPIVWSTGDIIVALGATFVNQGTLLLIEQTNTGDGRSPDLGLAPRIRGPRKGEEAGSSGRVSSAAVDALVGGASVVATGGAGSTGGGGKWAWEELSYDG